MGKRLCIAILTALMVSGCAMVVKQGTPAPVDPLTRKYY